MDQAAWLWGLAGAFLYAAPRLVLCVQAHRERWSGCLATFAIAMFAGPVMAEAFGPWIGYRFAWMVQPDGRALFVTIGLSANPVAPLIVNIVRGHIARYGRLKDDSA